MTMNERCPTVLIIDDDTVARLLARDALEQSGWAVQEVENGRRRIEAFVRYHPDLVLLDIMMSEMDGFAVCAEVATVAGWQTCSCAYHDGTGRLSVHHPSV